MRSTILIATIIFCGVVQGNEPGQKLDLRMVPLPVNSYRLLAMSMDDDGFIWAGSIHRMVHRYASHTGKVENIELPYQATASACICVGKKVYILGQTYPKLIIYDRPSKKFSEVAYPSAVDRAFPGCQMRALRSNQEELPGKAVRS